MAADITQKVVKTEGDEVQSESLEDNISSHGETKGIILSKVKSD